jgi:hypothetical protein
MRWTVARPIRRSSAGGPPVGGIELRSPAMSRICNDQRRIFASASVDRPAGRHPVGGADPRAVIPMSSIRSGSSWMLRFRSVDAMSDSGGAGGGDPRRDPSGSAGTARSSVGDGRIRRRASEARPRCSVGAR